MFGENFGKNKKKAMVKDFLVRVRNGQIAVRIFEREDDLRQIHLDHQLEGRMGKPKKQHKIDDLSELIEIIKDELKEDSNE